MQSHCLLLNVACPKLSMELYRKLAVFLPHYPTVLTGPKDMKLNTSSWMCSCGLPRVAEAYEGTLQSPDSLDCRVTTDRGIGVNYSSTIIVVIYIQLLFA